MQQLDLFRPAPKARGMFDRTVPLSQTAALIPRLRKEYGITRIADLTYLDRSGIPALNAVVPESPDSLSVYNGKGVSREHARVGAVLEAVERQVAAAPRLWVRRVCFEGRRDALDPRELGFVNVRRGREIEAVLGYDLMSDEPVYIPLAAVQVPWRGEKLVRISTSNGLASGNTLLEAVYHALFELIERHVWAVTHVRGYILPLLRVEAFVRRPIGSLARKLVDDPVGVQIHTPTGFPLIDKLLNHLNDAGLTIRITAVSEGNLPITVFACVSEPHAQPPVSHIGIGCSWSPEHATVRAITEAVQSRLVDIQGAREDVLRASDPPSRFGNHGRRNAELPRGRWYFDAPMPVARLIDLPDRSSKDLAEDLRRVCGILRAEGVDRVAIVQLSDGDSPIFVVRAVAPRLESFMVDHRIGPGIDKILGRYRRRFRSLARNS